MSQESRYYYWSEKNSYSNRREPQLLKWNEFYFVEINEAIDHSQCLSVTVEKLEPNLEKPKSTKYEKVKPIIEEIFYDYYFHALRNISKIKYENGEFYIIESSKKHIQLEHYCDTNNARRHVNVNIFNNIEDLWITLNHDFSFSGRPGARKNGTPITGEEFKQYINLILKFLSDPKSYKIYLDNFVNNFYILKNGENIIDEFDISSSRAFNNILEQLNHRKEHIEKMLIENDDLTKEGRLKLRGELDGIYYGIRTVKTNK